MTVTVLRANIMLVVAYRRAALELIFNVKNKTLSIETQTRSIRTIHNLLYLESAVVIYSTVVMHAFRISTTYFTRTHTHRTAGSSGMYETGGRHRVDVTPHPIALKHTVGQL